ncbi:MAG: hypothetical protein J2P50_07240 [Hyphomicrobiaceae bacterium]|nr:hypothetical protein [Hyphomicrobiaceae bacterium]
MARAFAREHALEVWDVGTGQLIRRPDLGVDAMAISADGRRLVSAALVGSRVLFVPQISGLTLWDVTTGREIQTFRGYDGPMATLAVSPDGVQVMTGGGAIRTWRMTGSLVADMEPRGNYSSPVAHTRAVNNRLTT